MPDILGIKKLAAQLMKLKIAAAKKHDVSVTVGFSQNYALHVHETHRTHSKYLETPSRMLGPTLGKMIVTAMKAGVSTEQSLVLAGMRLQREAQQLVPVDTGALKASAFTAPTRVESAAINQALAKSNKLKRKKKRK